MDLKEIRKRVTQEDFFVTDHALTEGFKDGITVADMLRALQTGKIIEEYPERFRCLVLGHTQDRIPVHVVIDYSSIHTVDIITTYIPQRDQWIKSQIRKKRRR